MATKWIFGRKYLSSMNAELFQIFVVVVFFKNLFLLDRKLIPFQNKLFVTPMKFKFSIVPSVVGEVCDEDNFSLDTASVHLTMPFKKAHLPHY